MSGRYLMTYDVGRHGSLIANADDGQGMTAGETALIFSFQGFHMLTTFDRVKTIVVEQLGVDLDAVTPEATFSDGLGCDSLDRIELMMAAEEEFGIAIEDTEAERVVTVREMVALVDVKLAQQAGKLRHA